MRYLLKLIAIDDYKTIISKVKQVQTSGKGGGPILVILRYRNNWMSPNDLFRVTGSKTVFDDSNLSTEIQFSTDGAYLSTESKYLYWPVSSNKKNGNIAMILTPVLW